MPVLYNSDSTFGVGLLPICVVLGSVVFLSILLILRWSKPAPYASHAPGIMSMSHPTTTSRPEVEKIQIPAPSTQNLIKDHSQGPNPPLPTLQPLALHTHHPPSASTQSFATPPTEVTVTSLSSERITSENLPRRRSYSRTLTVPSPGDSQISEAIKVQVSGEVVLAEGWRRHTRVFGGSVCKACEGNQRNMAPWSA